MPSDTTARQNAVIWSATGAFILILLGIIGWLINSKDFTILKAIDRLELTQKEAIVKSEQINQR
jgi:hypothetical protein